MRTIDVFFSSALLFALASAGCSFDLGENTEGENGNLRFEYSDGSCLFGCSLEQKALQGSQIQISTKGGDPEVALVARLAGEAVGAIASQTASCWCNTSDANGGSHSRSVDQKEKCIAAEAKSCSLQVTIETAQAGDAKLEVVDPGGVVVDRVTVHVRPAARIELDVRDRKPNAQGIYEVRSGEKLKIASKVLDAEGSPMIFARHGVSQKYADPTVVAPDSTALFGSTDVEDAVAKHAGEASLTVSAVGTQSVVRFRVTK